MYPMWHIINPKINVFISAKVDLDDTSNENHTTEDNHNIGIDNESINEKKYINQQQEETKLNSF